MSNEELIKIRELFGFTQGQMADVLRIGLRQYQRLEAEGTNIKPVIGLAVELLKAVKGTEIGQSFGV